MKKTVFLLLLILIIFSSVGCRAILGFGMLLGMETVHESSPEKYGCWEKYHSVPSFLPEKLDGYTVNSFSYTLYNYFDTCYEVFLDLTVSKEQFYELIENSKSYSDAYTEKSAYYADGYIEIVFADMYENGEIDEYDGLRQVGNAEIDKVICNSDTCNIIFVSFHAEDTGVYDVENVAYFNRFSISPESYIDKSNKTE